MILRRDLFGIGGDRVRALWGGGGVVGLGRVNQPPRYIEDREVGF